MILHDLVKATIAPEIPRVRNLDMDLLAQEAFEVLTHTVHADRLGTGLDGAKLLHQIETTWHSACVRGGALGKDVWESLQDPATLEQLDRFAAAVTFLASHVTGLESTSVLGITVLVTFLLRSRLSSKGQR